MRETNFIKQNKEKWKEFEQTLSKIYHDPDKLKKLFTQITDDLSFARTFYPNRSVRVYLNSLAQQTFFNIYKSKKSKRGRILSFWVEELPHLMWQVRQELLLALIVFLLAIGIGIVSCMADQDFVRVILGDGYVEMTKANISKGDPMAVYKDESAFGMFLGITSNNIFVSFLAFLLGITYIGTIGLLIRNGVMLGSFQYFFVEYDLFWESFLTVWMHGAFEITSIVLAGAAGLTIGKGLMFPGTLSRVKAFQVSARRGIKIMIGLIPFFIAAGFIESFLTRHTEIPDIIRGIFILGCFIFIVGYFVIYPWWLAKKGLFKEKKEAPIPVDKAFKIDLSYIKKNGEIFTDVFAFFRENLSKLMGIAAIGSLLYCILVFSFTDEIFDDIFYFPYTQLNAMSPLQLIAAVIMMLFTSNTLWEIGQFFSSEYLPFLPVINILIFSILTFLTFFIFKKVVVKDNLEINLKSHFVNFIKSTLIVALLIFIISISDSSELFSFLMFIFGFPFLLVWAFVANQESKNIFQNLNRTGQLISGKYGKILGLFFMLLITGCSFFLLFDTVIAVFLFEFIGLNLSFDQATMDEIAIVVLTFMATFMMYLVYMIILTGFGVLYFTLLEIKDAPNLRKEILNIGNQRFIRGLERE